MPRYFVATALLFSLIVSIYAFNQGGFAAVTGSVTDGTGALIRGATAKATSVDIAIVTANLSNKA